jgi:two-component system response regulator
MSNPRILLIEDDPDHAELTLMGLKEANIPETIYVAKDGEEALQFLFSRDGIEAKPKFVLLDLKLPKLDGLEVLGRIKADERSRSIPVVVLTSSQNERDIMMSYRLGANSYIVKPVQFEKFISAVSQLGSYWVLLNEPPL